MKSKTVLLMIVALLSGHLYAQPGVVLSDAAGWHKIGETRVDFKKEREEVRVMGANRFASVKFKVTEAPIDIIDMEIHYDGDIVQNVKVNSPMQAGGESRVIDIPGQERDIRKIAFIYRTLPNRQDEKAHVEIWGRKTNVDKKDKDRANDKDRKMDDKHDHK